MKILLVTSSLPNGGKERQIIELAKSLDKRNVELKIVSFSTLVNARGIEYIEKMLIIVDKSAGYIHLQKEYYKVIKRFSPDIVHAWDHMSALLSVLPKCLLDYKLIDGSIRGSKRYLRRNLFMLLTCMFSDKVVANSKAGLESALRKNNSKNIVIYNGYQPSSSICEDDYHDFSGTLKIPCMVVGMVANIRPVKDYLGFIKLAQILMDQREDVIFVSLGEGKIDPVLINSIEPELRNRIIFLGRIDNPEKYIGSFDVGLLLNDTRYGKEGISNTIMEYMAMGKPVVATNSGGNSEIVKDGESGFLVPAFDMNIAAQKINLLLENRKMRESFGMKGREILFNKFSIELMTMNYLLVYKELLRY